MSSMQIGFTKKEYLSQSAPKTEIAEKVVVLACALIVAMGIALAYKVDTRIAFIATMSLSGPALLACALYLRCIRAHHADEENKEIENLQKQLQETSAVLNDQIKTEKAASLERDHKINNLTERFNTTSAEMLDLSEKHLTSKTQAENLLKEVDRLSNEKAMMACQIEQLQQQHGSKDYEATIAKLQKEIDDHQQQPKGAEAETGRLQKELAHATHELENLKSLTLTSADKIAELHAQLQTKESEIPAQLQKSQAESEMTALRSQIAAAETKHLKDLAQAEERYKEEIALQAKTVSRLTKEIKSERKLREEVEAHKKILDQLVLTDTTKTPATEAQTKTREQYGQLREIGKEIEAIDFVGQKAIIKEHYLDRLTYLKGNLEMYTKSTPNPERVKAAEEAIAKHEEKWAAPYADFNTKKERIKVLISRRNELEKALKIS